MDFRERVKTMLQESVSVEAKSGGAGSQCGPGYHKHPDAYGDKCHSIYQKHVRTQVGPNKSPNSKIHKTVKQLKVD